MVRLSTNAKQPPVNRPALRLALTYALFAALWIPSSNWAVRYFFADPARALLADDIKGWFFVALTAALLYGLVRNLLRQQSELHQREQLAQTERQHVQELLSAVAANSSDAVFAKDLEGRLLLCNGEAQRLFGKAGDQAVAAALDATERLVVDTGQPHTYEEALATPQGRRIHLTTKVPLRDGAGKIAGLFGISQDVTEQLEIHRALQASEQAERLRTAELAALLDAVPAAVWIAHDPAAMLITGNRLSYEWLKVPEGRNVSQSLPDEQRLGQFQILKDGNLLAPADMPLQRAATGAELRDYEFSFVYPDGTRRDVLGNAMPLRDEAGKPRGAISAFVDITDRRAAAQALQAAKIEADRANNAKSRFLAAASHDLRQPLAALGIYAATLKQVVGDDGRPLLNSMKACIDSLGELLTDLLDLSKLDAGVVTAEPIDFPLPDLLDSLAPTFGPEAEIKGLDFRLRSCGPTVHTDPALLRRIIGNFVANAIRYTERGGVLIACRRRQGKLWVEVRDTGIGFPPEKADEIFEEFHQLDESRSRGSGLGLAIAARTAALLGLAIRVASQPGRGSLFAIEVPPGRADEAPRAEAPAEPLAASPLRIALVEDNRHFREALAGGLEMLGHQVVAAERGRELMEKLGGTPPDVLITDFRLPDGESGYDVIGAVRDACRYELPAILLTADTAPMLVRSMAERGVLVLHKPVDLETLQAYLEDMVHTA